jgi:hypothetical protein
MKVVLIFCPAVMSICALFAEFARFLHSDVFRQWACRPDCPRSFSRTRKLPLPTLVTLMLSGMRMSVGAELDEFFGHLNEQAALLHEVSEQAFAQARAKLSTCALPLLNDWLLSQVEQAGLIVRWHGLRVVAADASNLRFGLRASHVPRAASTEQNAFGLFLPGAEVMLAATLYSPCVGERQMLFEHLDRLNETDLLVLDRGYPCRWLVALLNARRIRFCMRVERSGQGGFACVRAFLRSGLEQRLVTLARPDTRDTRDYECPATPQRVRLVREVSPNGAIVVLMTNLLDTVAFPAAQFGALYHQRWRIEEAFKRLKHRLNLEHVSGLSQRAVMQDFAARVLCDNLQALACFAAQDEHPLPTAHRINHAYAHTVLKPILPVLLLTQTGLRLFADAIGLLASHTYKHRQGLSKPRPPGRKPHKHMTQKPC